MHGRGQHHLANNLFIVANKRLDAHKASYQMASMHHNVSGKFL